MPNLLPSWDTDDVSELRRFAKVRLIVADLDGTLVPAQFLRTIQELKSSLFHHRYGVTLTLATGRTLAGAKPLLDKIALPKETPLILYNGSVVVTNVTFRLLKRETIPSKSLREILNVSSGYDVVSLAYFYDEPWFIQQRRSSNEHVIAWGKKCSQFREFNNMPVKWQQSRLLTRNAEPSSILIDTSRTTSSVERLHEELERVPDISITRSGSSYIEIRPKGSNKGRALESVALSYGLERNEILAIGDSDNDSEMLGWAGIGVSIAAASPRALSESDYVCRHGVFEGAVEVLRLVKHARHYFYQPKRSGKKLPKHEREPHPRLA